MDTSSDSQIERRRALDAWRYYWSLYAGMRGRVGGAVVAALAQSAILLPAPLLIAYLIDRALPGRNFRLVFLTGAALLLIHLAYGGLSLLTRHLILVAGTHAVKLFRQRLVEKCYRVSRQYFNRADHDRMHALIVQDTERVVVMSGMLIDQFLPSLVAGLALSLILVWLSAWLCLVALVVAPCLLVVVFVLRRKLKRGVNLFRQAFGTFSGGVNQMLRQMYLTQEIGAESFERERQQRNIEKLRRANMVVATLLARYQIAHGVLNNLAGALMLVAGGVGVVRGSLTVGQLLAVYAGFSLLRAQTHTLLTTLPDIMAGHESLTALRELLRINDRHPYSGTRALSFEGRVRLEDVHFSYDSGFALEGINLSLEPGRQVALIGVSGAGKSTVAQLILGFYRPRRGRVLLDGESIELLDLPHLRRQIGVVPQSPLLMPATVGENIAYGFPKAGVEQIERAARLAGIHDFIMGLPQRYESFLGADGVLLSGGQRQRIAIARALLREPRLLIFDEPTNHLDATAVNQLIESLQQLRPAPSMLLISHDLSIVSEAHHVYVLRDGRLVASGTPEAVLEPATFNHLPKVTTPAEAIL